MKTIELYRLILQENGGKIELASGIPTLGMASDMREKLYEMYPQFKSIVLESYLIPALNN